MKTIDDLLVGTKYEGASLAYEHRTPILNIQMSDCIGDAKANAALAIQLPKAVEALEEARCFIAKEFADPSAEQNGEWLEKCVRPLYGNICDAIATIREAQAIVEEGK